MFSRCLEGNWSSTVSLKAQYLHVLLQYIAEFPAASVHTWTLEGKRGKPGRKFLGHGKNKLVVKTQDQVNLFQKKAKVEEWKNKLPNNFSDYLAICLL